VNLLRFLLFVWPGHIWILKDEGWDLNKWFRASDCCLALNEKKISYVMVRTSSISMRQTRLVGFL